jgi:hypothetical protein
MRRGKIGLWSVAGLAAAGAATFLPAATADAALIIDLRFTDGTKTRQIAAGTYEVDVWALVSGTNDSTADEGLLNVYGSVQSQQVNGGALSAGTSGVTGNAGAGPVFTTGSPNGQAGTSQNITTDGVGDWGTVATSSTSTIKYNSALNNGLDPAFSNSSGVVANTLDANTVEFKVGTFTVTINPADINALAGLDAETRFNWVKATGTFPTQHSHRADGASVTAAAAYAASTTANAVSFTSAAVPEPASLGLLGLAAAAALGRRRR